MTVNSELHTWVEQSYETSRQIWPDVPPNEWWSAMVPTRRLTGIETARSEATSWSEVSLLVGDRSIPVENYGFEINFCDDFRLGEETPQERAARLTTGLQTGRLYHVDLDGISSGHIMHPMYMPFDFRQEDAKFGNPQLIAADGSHFRLSDVILIEGTATAYAWNSISPKPRQPNRDREKFTIRVLLESGWVTAYEADHDRNRSYGRSLYDLISEFALYGDDDTLEFYTVPDDWYGDKAGARLTA